jgi:hypothetical protein
MYIRVYSLFKEDHFPLPNITYEQIPHVTKKTFTSGKLLRVGRELAPSFFTFSAFCSAGQEILRFTRNPNIRRTLPCLEDSDTGSYSKD